MGLTIHYSLRSDAAGPPQARQQVEKLRQAALDLAMAEVGEVIELTGAECDFRTAREDSHGLILLHAHRLTPIGGTCQFLMPNHVIAFPVLPGDGCDGASFGLARYPAAIESKDGTAETGLNGWSWQAFCKTEYASNPKVGGIANFLRCHLGIIRLLDEAKEIGLLERVHDEGHYWENRDPKALAETVGQWNSQLAALVGQIKDEFRGQIVAAPITEFPNFEHLEADARKADQGDLQAEEAEADLCPATYGCPKCGERRHDWLVWDQDEVIHCQTCGHAYNPEDRPPKAAQG